MLRRIVTNRVTSILARGAGEGEIFSLSRVISLDYIYINVSYIVRGEAKDFPCIILSLLYDDTVSFVKRNKARCLCNSRARLSPGSTFYILLKLIFISTSVTEKRERERDCRRLPSSLTAERLTSNLINSNSVALSSLLSLLLYNS